MLYKFIAYLKFVFTATNQHGVHSPFIYNFVTECLYKSAMFKGSKTMRVFMKSIAYFNAKSVLFVPKNMRIQSRIKNQFPQIEFNNHPCDFIYLEQPNPELFLRFLKEGKYHNGTMVLINNIHQDKEYSTNWESLIKNGKVTVTIDMFHCGALFFRKEQAKEHFKIRI